LDLSGGKLAGRATPLARNPFLGFGSMKQQTYLLFKLVRTGNNVDHTLVPCVQHYGIAGRRGIGAVSNQVNASACRADLVIGSNEPPCGGDVDEKRHKRGAKVCWPTRLTRHRKTRLAPSVQTDTDVAMLNALIHTVIDERLGGRRVHHHAGQQLRSPARQRQGLQP
jgi:formate dehydrogenase major subunit